MNLVLMNTRSEHMNGLWAPYATSTPLKNISDQVEVNKTPKLLTQNENKSKIIRDASTETPLLVSKRTRKKRISNFFDLSSSSDDDLSDTERPIIKLNSKLNKKVLWNKQSASKNLNVKSIINEQGTNKKFEGVDIKNMGILSKDKNKCAINKTENDNFEARIKSDLCCTLFTESDEENVIIKKNKKIKNVVKGIKCHSKTKANLVSDLKINENFTNSNDFEEIEPKTLQVLPEENQMTSKIVDKNSDQGTLDLDCAQVKKIQNNKLSKFQKRKNNNAINNEGSVKKKTVQEDTKNVAYPQKKILSSVNLNISQNKSNLSHQLFSDSTEREYINTLDLTKNEIDETSETGRRYLQKGKKCKLLIWPHHSSHKLCIDCKIKRGRPKKNKKEILEKQLNKSCLRINAPEEAQCQKISLSGDFSRQVLDVSLLPRHAKGRSKDENSKVICKTKDFISQNISENEAPKEIISTTKNIEVDDDFINGKSSNTSVPGTASYFSETSRKMNISNESDKVCKKKTFKCRDEKKIVKLMEESVFKQSDELPFKDNESGCSVVQCWNTKNFKCGIFKLKIKAHLTCKTLHCNSSLGGVLIKGNLKMRIGIKEQDLKEGDMAFVPPLTEWQATNNGESESVFYYWCGRF